MRFEMVAGRHPSSVPTAYGSPAATRAKIRMSWSIHSLPCVAKFFGKSALLAWTVGDFVGPKVFSLAACAVSLAECRPRTKS